MIKPISMLSIFCLSVVSLFSNDNISKRHIKFNLSLENNANVVRLLNDKKNVTYVLEAYLNAWDFDSPDDQLGGSLCLRINKAGGKYFPGCLMCRERATRTFLPDDCSGVLTQEMLVKALKNSETNTPIVFSGSGMKFKLKILTLEFLDTSVSSESIRKVRKLTFEVDIEPDSSVPLGKRFSRVL
ncbi:MAG TPA: hypothetical protein VJ505_03960 [Holophagaceae bacterium]|nr:hypothetical protein [Holophagaceae bacterium]